MSKRLEAGESALRFDQTWPTSGPLGVLHIKGLQPDVEFVEATRYFRTCGVEVCLERIVVRQCRVCLIDGLFNQLTRLFCGLAQTLRFAEQILETLI